SGSGSDPLDLSARARRHALSEAEHRRLKVCLGSSATLGLLHAVGSDFDALPTEADGDAELVERFAEQAEQRFGAPMARRPRVRVKWLIAGWLLLGTATAAAWVGGQRLAPAPLPNGQPEPMVPSAAASRHASGSRQSSVPASPAPTVSQSALPPAPTQHPAASAGHDSAALSPPSAAGLFSRGNEARRRGQMAAAVVAYEELQAKYPRSAEAALSHVVLARRYLGQDPGRALQHFDAYLRSEPHGALAQESLHGRARALGMLGRGTEERRAWQDLLRHYPESVYANVARERLGESP
ncbi:MAG: tetratricopeptide repeat protein, partial [Polyangiaceae bacterium]|nr:tetratricopeptide repeat protein [Polyangiaceae bacterium]